MHDQEDYLIEAAERTKAELIVARLAEVEKLDEHVRVMLENAYRRGYEQGFSRGAEAVGDGEVPSSIESFLYGPLHDWRYSYHSGGFVTPPEWPHDAEY